jgi:hypothetical protein
MSMRILPSIRSWRRVALCAALAAPLSFAAGHDARASVSIAITFDGLLRSSSAVVIGTPVEQVSIWEAGRIYSYSRLHVDSPIAGELHGDDDVWVRTMGGIAGGVGQIVEGEAALTVGRPTLLFMFRSPEGPYVVTGRAQGQFGLYTDEQKQLRVRKSVVVGALLPPKGAEESAPPAGEMMTGRAVTEAARDIATAWGRTHAL